MSAIEDLKRVDKQGNISAYYVLKPTGGDPFYWPVTDNISIAMMHSWNHADFSFTQKASSYLDQTGKGLQALISLATSGEKNRGGVWSSGPAVYQTPTPLAVPINTKLISIDGKSVKKSINRFKELSSPKTGVGGTTASGAGVSEYSAPEKFNIEVITSEGNIIFKGHNKMLFMCTDFRVTFNAPFYSTGGDPIYADVQATFQSALPAFGDLFKFGD